jgi:hypothetical protein
MTTQIVHRAVRSDPEIHASPGRSGGPVIEAPGSSPGARFRDGRSRYLAGFALACFGFFGVLAFLSMSLLRRLRWLVDEPDPNRRPPTGKPATSPSGQISAGPG